ncbi:MAG: ABC transporter substrate-binding protein [Firmicutes bacterium]|nr:ABC transporter substrate-binding protein [Bacillota bacterium]
MKKKTTIIALILVLAMLLAACGSKTETPAPASTPSSSTPSTSTPAASTPQTPERKLKDTLTVGQANEPGMLNPQGNNLVSMNQVDMTIYEGLIIFDPITQEFKPSLAESWEQTDELTYVFHLRKGVKFHNGSDFTAEDVHYTVGRLVNESATKSLYSALDDVNSKVIDDYTYELHLKEPFSPFLRYIANARALIVCKDYLEEVGNEGNNRQPIGTGPFKFVEWVTGDHITVERNDEYWGEKPSLKNINFRFIVDNGIRAIELETGAVDLIYSVGAEDYDRLAENPDLVTTMMPGWTHENMLWNMQSKVFQDVNLRAAMCWALDVPSIVETVWGKTASPSTGLYSMNLLGGDTDLWPRERNVELAKEYLAKAGYPNGGFKCEASFPNSTTTQQMFEAAQAQWAEVGIEVELVSYDQATIKERNAKGLTDFGRSNFTASTGDPDHALSAWGIGYTGILQPNNETINDLKLKGRSTYDDAERAKIYYELQKYVYDNYMAIPIMCSNMTYSYNKNIENFTPTPDNLPIIAWIKLYE